jgi:hypothetical protein
MPNSIWRLTKSIFSMRRIDGDSHPSVEKIRLLITAATGNRLKASEQTFQIHAWQEGCKHSTKKSNCLLTARLSWFPQSIQICDRYFSFSHKRANRFK